MSREADTDIASAKSIRDESFSEAYQKHDIAESYITHRLTWYGYEAEPAGLNDRDSDEALTDDSPDLRIVDDGETVGYIEVKSKTSNKWLGRLNRRHFEKYLHGDAEEDDPFTGADELSVPVYVAFVLLDEEDMTIDREMYLPVESERQIEDSFYAFGNEVVELDRADALDWRDITWEFDNT